MPRPMEFAGLVVPTPTLFGVDGALSPEANGRFLRGLSDSGVPHLFVLGSLGEFPSVDEDERTVLVRTAIASLPDGTDVWVGVGAPATARAVRYAREAAAQGAAAVVAVPPYYLRPTDEAILSYYRAIHAATALPLFAYNIPTKVGYALSPELVHRLSRERVLTGIKDTAGAAESVHGFLDHAPTGFGVLPGDDVLARWAIQEGSVGAVMGTANVAPRLGLALVEAARRGDEPRATELQRLVERLSHVIGIGPFPSTVKFLAHRFREAPEGYRAPYEALTASEADRVAANMDALAADLAAYR